MRIPVTRGSWLSPLGMAQDHWRRWKRELTEAIYPRGCWMCSAAAGEQGACPEHSFELGFREPRCRRCLVLLGKGVRANSLCAGCRSRSPSYGRMLALGPYRPGQGLAAWVLALKYGSRPDLARPLGSLLAGLVPDDLVGGRRGVLVVPVPLHPLRRLERHFDQAQLLGRSVAKCGGLPFRASLKRTRWTAPQGSASARSRSANVRAAFELKPGARRDLRQRVVLLVDDVATSGSTLSACAQVLRNGGATGVIGLVLARAGAPGDSVREEKTLQDTLQD